MSGIDDAITKDVVDEIRDCNINTSGKDGSLSATIIFNKRGSSYEAVITVRSANGVPVVNNERLIFKKADGAGKEIALRMFGKGGSLVYEPNL